MFISLTVDEDAKWLCTSLIINKEGRPTYPHSHIDCSYLGRSSEIEKRSQVRPATGNLRVLKNTQMRTQRDLNLKKCSDVYLYLIQNKIKTEKNHFILEILNFHEGYIKI